MNYWLFVFEEKKHWNYCLKNSCITLDWCNIGDLSAHSSSAEILEQMKRYNPDSNFSGKDVSAWSFCKSIKCSDIVFAKLVNDCFLGRGRVISEYRYLDDVDKEYRHTIGIEWNGINRIECDYYKEASFLQNISRDKKAISFLNYEYGYFDAYSKILKKYTKADFLNDVFIDETKYESIIRLLERKKNLIIQGAPGVGKTYLAQKLAYSIIGGIDENRVKMIQFHQSYSYEDFIIGYRPADDEKKQFEKKKGVFLEFCEKAKQDSDHKYFFIIDEINRGNLSKIFGELLMLLESDKRNQKIQLLYSNDLFYIPSNLYLIGLMNTADRSLALMDNALRRRFAFVEILPAFTSEGFKSLQGKIENTTYNNLINCIIEINKSIENDNSLGRGFCIGHSYFIPNDINEVTEQWISDVVNYEIIPLLEEYWFDSPQELVRWTNELRQSIK